MSSYGQPSDAPGPYVQDPYRPQQPAGRVHGQDQPGGWSQPDPSRSHPPRSDPFQPEASQVGPYAQRQARGQAHSGYVAGGQQVWSTEPGAAHSSRQAPSDDPQQAPADDRRRTGHGQQVPDPVRRAIPVVTMGEIPGRRTVAVIGDVIGVVTRNRVQPQLHAGQQQVVAIANYEAALTSSRQDAIGKMIAMAVDAGADAVVGMRFDSTEISQALSEVSAYGTGVVLAGEQDGDQQATATVAGHPDETPHSTNPRGPTDRTTQSQAPQPGVAEPTPRSAWRPRTGSGTLFGDQEMSDHHAASSPVLPGHPQRKS